MLDISECITKEADLKNNRGLSHFLNHAAQQSHKAYEVFYNFLAISRPTRILEIGTGSGYQAAVLAAMGVKTYSMEIRPNLAREVKIRLKKLGYKVEVLQGDGYYGWNEHAPFDRVIITAAANHIPRPLLDQLKPGGKLILPLGNVRYSQNMTLIEKDSQGKMRTSQHGLVRFVPMVGAAQE